MKQNLTFPLGLNLFHGTQIIYWDPIFPWDFSYSSGPFPITRDALIAWEPTFTTESLIVPNSAVPLSNTCEILYSGDPTYPSEDHYLTEPLISFRIPLIPRDQTYPSDLFPTNFLETLSSQGNKPISWNAA